MTDAVSPLLNSLIKAAQEKECDLLVQVFWHEKGAREGLLLAGSCRSL